jgi:hypothetical protein|tara:strand:- start:701 stop:805 length:105 start_codon:yes stop_codon:yes gene_type:complete
MMDQQVPPVLQVLLALQVPQVLKALKVLKEHKAL